ncbi:hypothetical protein CfE428DRAFT_2420 [Chthoniobacter flavus Ellin428]|uniref:Uncharacterized protein n=1 Tax=Chthoniobacter flavus Ellin428 TaxID=497964 RepID=B4D0G9_9BACT|nr:hypothetical protein [Chthoniobacter flavus]EDY19831.1 hypothetical protein CfE428DRAFT_2420 [Chthoniobacter flavus Ellin428]
MMAAFGGKGHREAPAVRVRTPAGTAEVLRTHFAEHNRQVLMLTAATLVAALAAWALLYFVSIWMLVFLMAALDVSNAHIPHRFWMLYLVSALCGLALAWLDNRLNPNARPVDRKPPWEILMDFLLAVPRMTLAVGGNLAAWQKLSDSDLLEAAELLHRLGNEKRVPMSGVRLQIPDPEAALRILYALQMTQVIDTQREGNEFWLRLNSLRPASLRMTGAEQAAE